MTLTPARPSSLDWPGLDQIPTGPRAGVKSAIARRLFNAAMSRLAVTVHVCDPADGGSKTLGTGGPQMTIHRPEEFFARIGADGLIGFGEAYLTGSWDAPDLGGFLTVVAAEAPRLIPAPFQRLRSAYVSRPPRHQEGSVDNSRANIGHHYDLSNDMFETFLDPTLSYSSALFDTGIAPAAGTGPRTGYLVATAPDVDAVTHDLLEAAQGRKIERLLDAAGVTSGSRVLEIGTGWGELAIRAARRGATVHSVTLSVEQQLLARTRIDAAAADGSFSGDQISIELCDYREIPASEHYDAICSVEMIEAVGFDYWSEYFTTLDRLLAPGGKVGLQAITMPHDRMLATRATYTWIHKYIFPGGFLPSTEAIEEITATHTGLRVSERLEFGSHYAETLRLWDETFMCSVEQVRELGFDDTFVRMWHFYLEYSRGGFASGYLNVQQIVLDRPARP